MSHDPNIITTPGVEHGPYPPSYEYDTTDPMTATNERINQLRLNSLAVMRAWDQCRISSEETDGRLLALDAEMELAERPLDTTDA